jgi:hypothetical protein
MKFDTFEKGKPLLYLPEITERAGPYKVFFLFITEDYHKKGSYAKVVVCKTVDLLSICNTIGEFRQIQKEREDVLFNGDYKFVIDLNCLKEYDERELFVYEKMYLFLLEREEKYKRYLKNSYYFRRDEPDLFYSPFFSRLKRNCCFYKVRFCLRCAALFLKRCSKVIICPIIFLCDLIRNNYESFNAYMDYKARLTDYDNYTKRSKMLFFARGEKEFEREKEELEKKYHETKEKYINSTLGNFNLFVATIGLIFSIIINIFLVYTNSKEKEQMNYQIDKLHSENNITQQDIIRLETSLEQTRKEMEDKIENKDEIIDILKKELEILDHYNEKLIELKQIELKQQER